MLAKVAAYRELTVAALLLGLVQGVVLNLSFIYAALKLGFSIPGSTVASIMGYALLKGVLKKGTSIENNINQTVASGINTAGTGIVFTLPALFLLQQSGAIVEFNLMPFCLTAVAGALLGVVLIIPLRKQMIDLDRLRFPSGVAVTTIIRSGASGMSKAKLLGIGFLIAATWKLILISHVLDVPGVFEHEELNFGFGIIPAYLAPTLYLSLMNVAAGLLAGRGGLPFLLGGVLAWWVVSPASVFMGWVPLQDGLPDVGFIYGKMMRPLGIGVLIGGALAGVIASFPAVKSALVSLANASKLRKAGVQAAGADEMPFWLISVGVVSAVVLLFAAAMLTPGTTVLQSLIGAILGTLWLALAGIIVAQATGMTDISPLSGMALITVTIMMFVFSQNVAAAMIVGVAVAVAVGMAADMMQDLKTGFMLGARPWKQQVAQLATVWIGGLIGIAAIYVLWSKPEAGFGGFGPGTDLPAPQAAVLTGIVQSLQSGAIPVDKYALGGVVGALLGFAPMAGLGVLIGLAMYLPFSITLGYGIGCLIQMYIQKRRGIEFSENVIVPLAAGLIVGEALTGMGHAFFEILAK